VEADPDAQREAGAERLDGDRPADADRRINGVRRGGERGERPVALVLDDRSAVPSDRGVDQRVVRPEQRGPVVGRHRAGQSGGALDVAEQECDVSRRQRHAVDPTLGDQVRTVGEGVRTSTAIPISRLQRFAMS